MRSLTLQRGSVYDKRLAIAHHQVRENRAAGTAADIQRITRRRLPRPERPGRNRDRPGVAGNIASMSGKAPPTGYTLRTRVDSFTSILDLLKLTSPGKKVSTRSRCCHRVLHAPQRRRSRREDSSL